MYFDRRLWELTRGLRGRIVATILIGLLASLVGISRFVLLGMLIAGVFQGAAVASLMPLALAVALAVILRGAMEHARTMVANRTAAEVQQALRGKLYDKIAALGPSWFANERTGGHVQSVVDGVEQLQIFFGRYVPQMTVAALTPILIFAIIAWWDVTVASVLLVAAIVGLFAPIAFRAMDTSASRNRNVSFRAFSAEFLDAIQGLATLKAFGQSRAYGIQLADKARKLSNTTMWLLTTGLMTRGVIDVAIAFGAAGALALGAYRVTHGEMSLQALLIVLMAGTEIFRPLRDFRGVLHEGMIGQAAGIAINELLSTPVEQRQATVTAPQTLAPTVDFANVRFSYPGGRGIALDGVSFSLSAGERVGVVGPSGSGKSTIARLLLQLYTAQEGVVKVGGIDIRALDPDRVREQIAVVQQDTYLFHGTIEDNLRLGKQNATQSELEAAARAADAHDFIAGLPHGYRTIIGERGARLSGGQRQRIAIARALLRNAPILILDEAMSSVDAETEATIQKALDRLMAGRTVLVLAHRLSSVIGTDRILVVEQGRIVESGSHDVLIRRDGAYRRLMGAQADERETYTGVLAEHAAEDELATEELTEIEDDGEEADSILRVDKLPWGKTLGWLGALIAPWWRRLGITMSCGIGRVITFISVGVFSSLAVAAVKHGGDYWTPLSVLLIVAPISGVLAWCETWLAHDMAYRLLAEMRIDLFNKLDTLAPAYLLRRRSGDLVSLATQDVETVESFFAHTITPSIVAVLIPAAILLTLAWFAWPTALVLLPFLLYVAVTPVFVRRRIDRLGAAAREGLGRMTAHITDTIQGLSELVSFQALGHRGADFQRIVGDYHALRLILYRDLSLQSALLEVATGLGGLCVALTGAYLAASGRLDPTMLPLLTLLAIAAFLPVSEIAYVSRQLADTFASAHRLQKVHSEKVPVIDGLLTPLAPARGGSSIRLDHVNFTYPGRQRAALSDLSLDVPPGATLALVGPSGSGKTTLGNLLLRFWDPGTGAITLDNIDLKQYQLDHLRGRIALVAQDTYLFNTSLRANVLIARPEASEAEVSQAIERAALADFIATLPEGLGTKVGERGVQLSGGQRQRVAIARAFLKNAPVLILDEATSHLDAVSEAQVRAALEALMQERTTIVIAHRLSTIRDASMIAVLDRGRLVETGTHDGLIARGGLYAELVEHQLGLSRAAE
ncbi:MAG TPA: thiol reductant ABC exporter subunit CydC [Stellaceae bacterium]|jgi:ATP-binding cassette subfamily C protein CydCD|nr:thiol reductant ABC exporter subunit CydC [Stellaceae bacterium]